MRKLTTEEIKEKILSRSLSHYVYWGGNENPSIDDYNRIRKFVFDTVDKLVENNCKVFDFSLPAGLTFQIEDDKVYCYAHICQDKLIHPKLFDELKSKSVAVYVVVQAYECLVLRYVVLKDGEFTASSFEGLDAYDLDSEIVSREELEKNIKEVLAQLGGKEL